jgi:hypothetical protein
MRDLINLVETLDSAAEWKWTKMSDMIWDAAFEVGEFSYDVHIEGNRYVIVTFTGEGPGTRGKKSYDSTGSGKATTVLATVIDVVLAYIAQHPNLDCVVFEAGKGSPGRVRLYSRLAQKVGGELGWHLETSENHKFTMFSLKKPGKGMWNYRGEPERKKLTFVFNNDSQNYNAHPPSYIPRFRARL